MQCSLNQLSGYTRSPYRLVKINWDAVGGRSEPQNGLKTCFEPLRTEFQSHQFSKRQVAKRIPTAEFIFTTLTANIDLTTFNCLCLFNLEIV